MQTRLAVVEGPYLRDILEQPAALTRSLDLLSRQDVPVIETIDRFVLTGMGSSFHALHPLHRRLNRAGYFAQMIETSELIHFFPSLLRARTLTIAVSQSGESAEMRRLLDLNDGRSPLIGITNSADSTLARRAFAPVLLAAGPEATVSCKTYVATLQALHWVGTCLLLEDRSAALADLESAAPATAAYLRNWNSHVDELADILAGVQRIFVTGRGDSLATAGTGGLILKESARFGAEGMSSAAFRHGPFEMLSSAIFVAIALGAEPSRHLNRTLAADIEKAGGRAALISSGAALAPFRLPESSPAVLPMLEILPIQMISLALASMQGHEAGRFALATKITAVE